MKKVICVLLCCVLLCAPALPSGALAQDTATIDIAALIGRQASSSATLRARLTLTPSGPTPFFMTEEQWSLLCALAPGASLEGSYVLSRLADSFGDSQLNLYLKRGGETLSTLRLSGRGESFLLSGDALGDTVLRLPRDTEVLLRDKYLTLPGWRGVILRDAGLLQAMLSTARAWPGLRRALAEVFTADESWQEEAEAALAPYYAQLSAWLQARAVISLERDEVGNVRTVSALRASLAECGEEAAALLRMFYNDQTLLGLLRAHMTPEEAEAYLEPGMLRLFESTLAQLPETGELTLRRVYTAGGKLAQMELTLPLADGAVLSLTQEGDAYALHLPRLSLTLAGSGKDAWQGRFALGEGEETVSGEYQLFASLGGTYTDASGETVQRRQSGMITLIVTPDAGQAFPAQVLTVKLEARAGEKTDQAAYWYADIDWQETGGGADIHAVFQMFTGKTIRQSEPVGNETALASLTEDERQALLQQIITKLAGALGLPAEN